MKDECPLCGMNIKKAAKVLGADVKHLMAHHIHLAHMTPAAHDLIYICFPTFDGEVVVVLGKDFWDMEKALKVVYDIMEATNSWFGDEPEKM